MQSKQIKDFIASAWSSDAGKKSTIIKALEEFITIPNDSPAFDPDWAEHGYMDKAMGLLTQAVGMLQHDWAKQGCKTDDVVVGTMGGKEQPEFDGTGKRRTPIIVIEVPAFGTPAPQGTVFLYGHMDKQPPLDGKWSPGLGPRQPVIKDDKLYGRGSGDDGYAIFSAFSAIMALRNQNLPHARCIILVESCEESGSADLEYYVKKIQARLGEVTLIVCLDSGCENYDQLWTTTSLRGLVSGTLSVKIMKDGVHSGDASGIVPSSFRILRQLLSRLEDELTGEVTPAELQVRIPLHIRQQAEETAVLLGNHVYRKYPFLPGVKPVEGTTAELILNRTWRSELAVIGMDGIPRMSEHPGNVMLPHTAARLSFRLPPTLDSERAAAFIKDTLEKNPPYGAQVEFADITTGNGWAAPEPKPWLKNALVAGSREFFGNAKALAMGEGGSIPFMNMLGEMFPQAQFLVTGVLGPHSNAHGPDEFLDLPIVQKVTMCVALMLGEHGRAMMF